MPARSRIGAALGSILGALVLLVIALAPGRAAADGGDGVYGRFDGDLVVSAGAGGGTALGVGGEIAFELRARYLDTAGLVLAGQGWPGRTGAMTAALDVRPLFPLLFLVDASTGIERLDLLIGSIGFEVGAALTPLGTGAGAALALGMGLDLPLLLPSTWAQGVHLRLAFRHVRASPGDQAGPEGGVAQWSLLALLTVRASVSLGFAAAEPPRYRTP